MTWCMNIFSLTCSCLLQPNRFADISPSNSRMISSVSGIHIIQSFISCIANVMEGSGLNVYVTAAYGRLNGIFNSKSWVKALRSYNNVESWHLKRFLSRGPTSFEPIDEYLDTAWAHPTVPHWVYNFLLPTLLIHQFEHVEWEGNHYFKHIIMECTIKSFFFAGQV